jgi:hypothetical protein
MLSWRFLAIISVEVLELRIGLFYFGVTFALLLAEKVAFHRIFVAGVLSGTEISASFCSASSLELCFRIFSYQ